MYKNQLGSDILKVIFYELRSLKPVIEARLFNFLSFQSKPAKVVHFPVNILALRTVHKYERMDSFEGDDDSAHEEDGTNGEVVSDWSRDYPIASEDHVEDQCNCTVEKDLDSLDSTSTKENGAVVGIDVSSDTCEDENKKGCALNET